MKKIILTLALLLLSQTPSRADVVPSAPDMRLAITPMLGMVGGFPGAGIDLSMGRGKVAWGIRHAGGAEICIMCDGTTRSESYTSLSAGLREEFAYGSIALKTGIAKLDRKTNVNHHYSEGKDEHYDGFGVPFQLDLVLGGRYVGLSVSATVMAGGNGGSGGILFGIPLGLLRK